MEFYLVTSDHLSDRIWFRDEEDFKAGMNAVAASSCKMHMNMLAFILMSNHVHFVVQSDYDTARRFIDDIKRAHSKYIRHKYGVKELLRRNSVDIQRVDPCDESLERAIAYVQMNGVAANICLTAADYPWGSGNAFFNPAAEKGTLLDNLSHRARIRLIHSKQRLPDGLLVSNGGYILPRSYIKVAFVESLFRSPRRMMYFLQNSSKARSRLETISQEGPSFRDQVVQAAMNDLCRTLYRKDSVQSLSDLENTEILKQTRYRFSSNINQMARVSGLTYDTVTRLLETY